jgi:hypothetical protein
MYVCISEHPLPKNEPMRNEFGVRIRPEVDQLFFADGNHGQKRQGSRPRGPELQRFVQAEQGGPVRALRAFLPTTIEKHGDKIGKFYRPRLKSMATRSETFIGAGLPDFSWCMIPKSEKNCTQ